MKKSAKEKILFWKFGKIWPKEIEKFPFENSKKARIKVKFSSKTHSLYSLNSLKFPSFKRKISLYQANFLLIKNNVLPFYHNDEIQKRQD